jgi:pimeloyl-ACP methyl ester carboxylesterase
MIRYALLAAIALPAPAQAHMPPAAVAAERLVQRPHISIRDEGGSGPAVILIPGLATPRAVWDGVVPALRARHRVLTVQVNGFGGDDPRANLAPGILDGIVADLAAYIGAEKIAKPAVVGHSLGGLVAMMLAARQPEQVGRVMVVDALPFIGTLFDPAATPDRIKPMAERARDGMVAATPPATPPATPVATDPGGIWSITPTGRITVANWSRAANAKVAAQAMYEDMITDLRPEVRALTVPLTVLYATGAGPQATAIWERDYAGSRAKLVPIADSYHFIMLDQPAAFAAALDGFLRP